MRAWKLTGGFGVDNLSCDKVDEPGSLSSIEVRVKIHACSLNYRDVMVIRGHYNPEQRLPLIPLSDGAGEVVEIGSEVTAFRVGDRVCSTFSQKWCHGIVSDVALKSTLGSPLDGVLCESRVLSDEGLIKFPEYLSYEEAATLPVAAVTAFNALAYQASISPGGSVLIEGTGGVSLFALQFAQIFGLEAIVLSSSNQKLARAREIAPCQTINYRENPNWSEAVRKLTNGQGVDTVIEVGGAQTISKAIASTKKGGVVCVIGVLTGVQKAIDLRPLLMNNIRLQGIIVGSNAVFAAMNRVFEHSRCKPVVDRVFDFADAPAALSYLESQAHFGKVCIKITS